MIEHRTMKHYCPQQKKRLTKEKLSCVDCKIKKSMFGCKTYNAINNNQPSENKIEEI